jgi:hypothetical protein
MPKELQEIGKEKIIYGNNMSDGLDYYGNNLFQEIGDGLTNDQRRVLVSQKPTPVNPQNELKVNNK